MVGREGAESRTPAGISQNQSSRAESLRSPHLQLDLWAEIKKLFEQEPLQRAGRNAKTLAKYPDLRIVLTVIKARERVHEHQAAGCVSIQTLAGHIRLHLPDAAVDLPAGKLLALDQGMPHDVEALEDSAFLVTIAWPRVTERNH